MARIAFSKGKERNPDEPTLKVWFVTDETAKITLNGNAADLFGVLKFLTENPETWVTFYPNPGAERYDPIRRVEFRGSS
jgi:hypothetical protein